MAEAAGARGSRLLQLEISSSCDSRRARLHRRRAGSRTAPSTPRCRRSSSSSANRAKAFPGARRVLRPGGSARFSSVADRRSSVQPASMTPSTRSDNSSRTAGPGSQRRRRDPTAAGARSRRDRVTSSRGHLSSRSRGFRRGRHVPFAQLDERDTSLASLRRRLGRRRADELVLHLPVVAARGVPTSATSGAMSRRLSAASALGTGEPGETPLASHQQDGKSKASRRC